MSWEPVEEFPGENRGGGGAFRGQAMPVVARRRAPTLRERFRLLWHSTPELTYRRSAKRLLLTPGHLYVERFDGDRSRVARGSIRGRRLDRGRVVYGVVDGEDLALLPRGGCDVIAALEAQLRGDSEPTGSITKTEGHMLSVGVAVVAWVLAVQLYREVSFGDFLRRIARDGSHTSETALIVYGVAGLALFGVVVLLAVPVRTRIDAVGVHRARGIFPWLHTVEAPEDFRGVVVSKMRRTESGIPHIRLKVRLLRAGGGKPLDLESFDSEKLTRAETRAAAGQYATRVGELLDLEVGGVG
ncbi:MAG: hypothetical protein DRJ42_07530 [Deltaproteobacteria bacterium]|nr:MAG: hypothetical protein DRJ42_07530 [Deltaproteobacteria bacterium]